MSPKVFLLTLLVVTGLLVVVPWINRRNNPLGRHSANHSKNRAIEAPEPEDGRPAPGIKDAEELASKEIDAPMDGAGDAAD